MLQDKLLNTSLFENNEYFNKYVKLIEANLETKQQKFKTQKHHIIPKIAFQLCNWDGCEKKENKVNLLYKDHILAHYYLALAAKDSIFKYKMICAINFILGNAKEYSRDVDDLKKFIFDLDQYQQLYEESKKYFADQIRGTTRPISEETRQKISESNSDRVYVNKDGVVRALKDKDEVELFLSNGWALGNPNCQNRDQKKGCTIVNKDGIEKYVQKDELQTYLNDGWSQGRSAEHKKAVQHGTQKFYDSLSKDDKIKKCATYGMLGKHQSEYQKQHMRNVMTGKKQSEYQKLKNSLNKKGTIHMTNGVDDVMIKPEREQEFVKLGYHRGRSKNRKNSKRGG